MAKSTNSQTQTWRRRLDMEIRVLRRAISLLREVRRGLPISRLLHELQPLRHQLIISRSEICEVTINWNESLKV